MENTALLAKYNIPGADYRCYPTPAFWEGTDFTTDTWGDLLRTELSMAATLPAVLNVHLPYCEGSATCTDGTCVVASDHSLEAPYVEAILTEFHSFRELLGIPVLIKGIYFTGNMNFFSAAERTRMVQGLIKNNRVEAGAELGVAIKPGVSALAWMTIGLGVSAVSDARVCLVQNDTDLERYLSRVTEDWDIPVSLGHQLSEEDIEIRACLLALQHQGEAQLPAFVLQGEFCTQISAELREMQADGLVSLTGNTLKVTETGRNFLQNVCMALDLRLRRSQPAGKVLSLAN